MRRSLGSRSTPTFFILPIYKIALQDTVFLSKESKSKYFLAHYSNTEKSLDNNGENRKNCGLFLIKHKML